MVSSVVIVHTDFRLYWQKRLRELKIFLAKQDIRLSIIEISGKGSPYSFAQSSNEIDEDWYCLFPDKQMEEIPASDAIKKILSTLDMLQPDVVIGGAIAFPSGAGAVRWATKNKVPVVIFDDARLSDVQRAGYVDWVKRQIYSLVDSMLIPAPSHNDTYRYFGFSDEQLFYGVNAVDNEFFNNEISSVEEDDINIPHEPFILAVGGRSL
jgi:hypothetical protein